jgi:hypothetical protein
VSIQVPPPEPGPDIPDPPPEDPAPPADPPAPDPRPPVEPDPEPVPSPQPPGVDAPLKDDASLGELLAAEGLGDVRVEIRAGRAVLRGVVEEPRLQEEAGRLAAALDGVDRVENEIGLPSS